VAAQEIEISEESACVRAVPKRDCDDESYKTRKNEYMYKYIFDFHVDKIVDQFASSPPAPDTVELELAPDCCLKEKDHKSPFHLHIHDIHQPHHMHVCALVGTRGGHARG